MPWKLHQNYLRDVPLVLSGSLEGEGISFQRRQLSIQCGMAVAAPLMRPDVVTTEGLRGQLKLDELITRACDLDQVVEPMRTFTPDVTSEASCLRLISIPGAAGSTNWGTGGAGQNAVRNRAA